MPTKKSKNNLNPSKARAASSKPVHYRTRMFLVVLLIVLGAILTAGYSVVRWTETQLLSTGGWTAIVGPLPKNAEVATAVSTYTVTQLFDAVDVQQKITDALPDRATFLAAPLTKQLQTQANDLTKQFVMSDQFQNIWIAATGTAHSRLVDSARGIQPEPLPIVQKAEAKFNINLPSLKETIISRLGQSSSNLFGDSDKVKNSAIIIGLKAGYNKFRDFVRTTDALYSLLPFAVLASFLGAVAIAIHRQKALVWVWVSAMIACTLQIVGLNALRPQIINMIENNLYRPAAQAVWSAMINPFNSIVRNVFIVSTVLLLVTIFFGPYSWTKRLRQKLRLNEVGKAKVFGYANVVRQWAEQYKRYIWSGGGVVLLVFLAFYPAISWLVAAKALLVAAIFVSLVELFATRSYLKQ